MKIGTISLFRWDGFGSPTEFVGLRNDTDLFGRAFRLIFFLPYILAEIAAGLIWRFVYDGDYGLVASIAQFFGTASPHVLADLQYAEAAILSVIVWKYFRFHMMLYIAGLQAIDSDLYAAARVDGATRWQVLRRIKLPLLKPTLKLSVFFAILGSFQLFDLVMPMTRGGPSDSTQTMVSFLYSHGITRTRIGFGSAIGCRARSWPRSARSLSCRAGTTTCCR